MFLVASGYTRHLFGLCFLLALLLFQGCSDGGDSKNRPALPPAELASLAESISSVNGGRAAVLHITTAEGKAWDVVAGMADVESETEAKVGDLAEIGSISKVFLAVTVLRLIEQGVLSLEDPLSQWFDEAQLNALTANNGEQLVLRHLLNHSSGIGDYLNFAPDNTVLEAYGVTGDITYMPEDLIERTIALTANPVDPEGHQFPWFTPQNANGASYPDYDAIPYSAYSNTGYAMLGIIVQAVTGERYEDMIRQEIITPLGLDNTGFGTDGVRADLTGYALGLEVSGEGPVETSPTLSWSAGQIISTPQDLARFILAALNGELFDKPDTLELWKTQHYKPMFEQTPYGLGIYMNPIEGVGTVYGHDGQVFGAVSLVVQHIATGDVYVAAVNNSQYVSVDDNASASIWELVQKLHKIAEDNR
jgi:D-alanyl-D-alanine carboxypeptidase